jgi:lysophospholipase L1-like esterase
VSRILRQLLLIGLLIALTLALIPPAKLDAKANLIALNDCVALASDSNGYGHVTFQLGQDGDVGIVYIRPYWAILREELDRVGLRNLTVFDGSLSAGGLTSSEATNYLRSIPYGNVINNHCRFVIVGPFIPDVAAGKATPEQYRIQLARMVQALATSNPGGVIFVLNHYQTARAEFTAHNSGVGMRPERIAAFNEEVAAACELGGSIGRFSEAICVDTQAFFEGMGSSYILGETTKAQYEAMVHRNTGFRPRVEAFFQNNPSAKIIGDGIHLSLAGRVRLLRRLAEWISRLSVL